MHGDSRAPAGAHPVPFGIPVVGLVPRFTTGSKRPSGDAGGGQSVQVCKRALTVVGGSAEVAACSGRCESSMREPPIM